MPYTPFTFDEVKSIFRASEAGKGHAGERHVDITNAQMWDRVQGRRGGRSIAAVTSFIKFDDQVAAALELLNHPSHDEELEHFRCEKKPGRPYMRIDHFPSGAYALRGGGTQTFPCSLVHLILDKDWSRPHLRHMHFVTFFGGFG